MRTTPRPLPVALMLLSAACSRLQDLITGHPSDRVAGSAPSRSTSSARPLRRRSPPVFHSGRCRFPPRLPPAWQVPGVREPARARQTLVMTPRASTSSS